MSITIDQRIMHLIPGHTYKFIFDPGKVPEGEHPGVIASGPYRVLQIMTFQELISANVTGYTSNIYVHDKFLKLRDMVTNTIRYTTSRYLSTHPVVTVDKYPQIAMTIDIGTLSNPGVLAAIKEDIAGYISSLKYAPFVKGWDFTDPVTTYVVTSHDFAGNPDKLTVVSLAGGDPATDLLVKMKSEVEDVTYPVEYWLDSVVDGVPINTKVTAVDTGTGIITLSKNITVSLTAEEVAIDPTIYFTVSGTDATKVITASDNLGLLNVMKLAMEADADLVYAIDNRVTGVHDGTKVTSIDPDTGEIGVSRALLDDLDEVTLRIHVPNNAQPRFTIDDFTMMAYDSVWLTEEEAGVEASRIAAVKPNIYEERMRLRRENAELRARVMTLEQALASVMPV